MERLGKRIAFLCTGDEIVNGDILDTNAPYFSQALIDHNFQPGTRLIVSDDQNEMESAIRYLLQDHSVLITLGGLGPTSDDRTRFAVSAAIEKPLQFDQASWERIEDMLHALGYAKVPENNRQQCLFPENADIYPNTNGTASACCIPHGEQLLFMLPGPPNECRPIFTEQVLPRLLKTDLQANIHRRSWMLLGVSEGNIAKQLDPMVESSHCDIGYRVSYPYLEVKLQSTELADLERMSAQVEAQIRDRLIDRGKKTASELFSIYLQENKPSISIVDQATQGRLATKLAWPDNHSFLFFNKEETDIQVKIAGLGAYWKKEPIAQSDMSITVVKNGKTLLDQTIKVPIRDTRTPGYAVELACECLLKTLRED